MRGGDLAPGGEGALHLGPGAGLTGQQHRRRAVLAHQFVDRVGHECGVLPPGVLSGLLELLLRPVALGHLAQAELLAVHHLLQHRRLAQGAVQAEVGADPVCVDQQEAVGGVLDRQPRGELGERGDVVELRPVAVPALHLVEDDLAARRDDGAAHLAGQVGVLVEPLTDLRDELRRDPRLPEVVAHRGPAGFPLGHRVGGAAADLGVHGHERSRVVEDFPDRIESHGFLPLVATSVLPSGTRQVCGYRPGDQPSDGRQDMKAVTWQGVRDIRVEEVPDPTIVEPTDAIIRVTSTGLCGSDLHLYEPLGPFMTPATSSATNRWASWRRSGRQ